MVVDAPPPKQGLQYTWTMRGCSRRAEITFEAADVGIDPETFRINSIHEAQEGSCLAVAIGRAISLTLERPISSANVNLIEPAMSSYRLLFDQFKQYPTEFELLDTTGLVAGLAHPTKLGKDFGLMSDALSPDSGVVYWPAPGACTHRIAMLFEQAEPDPYRLRVWFDTKWSSSDRAMNVIGRWVLIQLPASIRASDVEEVVEHQL